LNLWNFNKQTYYIKHFVLKVPISTTRTREKKSKVISIIHYFTSTIQIKKSEIENENEVENERRKKNENNLLQLK